MPSRFPARSLPSLALALALCSCDDGGAVVLAPDAGRPDAALADAGCAPETDVELCERYEADCEAISVTDRCGAQRTAECGSCTLPATCGGGGVLNRCGCEETDAQLCLRLGKDCGALTATDRCGQPRTVSSCGTCASNQTCGAAARPNLCGVGSCTAETDAELCAKLGKDCDSLAAADRCGALRTLQCGTCPAGEKCGVSQANVCGCRETDAEFCSRSGRVCGPLSGVDLCGEPHPVLSCGECPSSQPCGADGRCVGCAPQCGGRECGPDGCGGQCGTCTAPEACSAAGACVAHCAPQCAGKECGADGCGGSCGTCTGTETCDAAGQCVSACVPQCTGKDCGADGCGGQCGTCTGPETCDAAGHCVAAGAPSIDSLTASGELVGDAPSASITISALVSDPDGVGDLAGGLLRDPATGTTLGAFGGAVGVYSLELEWSDLAPSFGPAGATRTLEAVFYDRASASAAKTVEVRLRCALRGEAACAGACVDLQTDAAHCGACAHSCAAWAGSHGLPGTASCGAGQCWATLVTASSAPESCATLCAGKGAACSDLRDGSGASYHSAHYQGCAASSDLQLSCAAMPAASSECEGTSTHALQATTCRCGEQVTAGCASDEGCIAALPYCAFPDLTTEDGVCSAIFGPGSVCNATRGCAGTRPICDPGSSTCVGCLSNADCPAHAPRCTAKKSCVGEGSCQPTVVVSQIYASGGNSGAVLSHDFVELHNRSPGAVGLAGWTVQYGSASSSTWTAVPLTGSISAGGYHLVQLAGGTVGSALPAADSSGGVNLSATAGKVALVSADAALSGCPGGGAVVDLVGYGSSANCFEGSAPAPAPSATKSLQRGGAGCADSQDSAADFATGAPTPRNGAAPAQACSCL